MAKIIGPMLLFVLTVVSSADAQQRPDFSGVWIIDPSRSDMRSVYGQMRVVTQTSTAVHVAVIQLNGRVDSVTTIPWRYQFGRWAPRRGGEQSREPVTRAEWDGETLVTVKAPSTSYTVLQAWTLSADGMEMVVQGISKSAGYGFDFKVAAIPRLYFGNKSVYVRIPAATTCPECSFSLRQEGVRWSAPLSETPFAFTLEKDSTALGITCHVPECLVTDIINGRRTASRSLSKGSAMTVPLFNTVVEARAP